MTVVLDELGAASAQCNMHFTLSVVTNEGMLHTYSSRGVTIGAPTVRLPAPKTRRVAIVVQRAHKLALEGPFQSSSMQVHAAGYGAPPRVSARDSESQEAAHDLEPITRGYVDC